MESDFQILFLSSINDLGIGSYRIWVNDLSKYFNEIGIKSRICNEIKTLNHKDVIIIAKSDIKKLSFYRKKYPNNLIGIINPAGGLKYNADFVIVGSIEEKDSLSKNENVFLFPLIEDKYRKITTKEHSKNSNKIVLGVHGSYTHLSKFNPNLKRAINEFSRDYEVTLKVITNAGAPKWRIGRPNISNIEIIPWSLETISDELYSCDIGIVPNLTMNKPFIIRTSNKRGLYDTDYFIRFKNKSNSGRAFVFIQHGIPVITDLTPSNIHIFGNPNNGYVVFSKEGWIKSLRELTSHERRNEVAINALHSFNYLYNPIEWAKELIKNIKELN